VIEHDPDAPAGLLKEWAAAVGLSVRTLALHAGQPFPSGAEEFDAVVMLGSEHTAFEDRAPWLAAERAFTDALVAESVPVLGICFGAQVLARVLGARVYRLTAPEIGWADIHSRNPALPAGPWATWHRDAFELPAGAVALADNAASLQAFAVGPHCGVQFHPEVTRPIMAGWVAGAQPPLSPGTTGPLLGEDSEVNWKLAADHAPRLFSAWLAGDLAAASATAPAGARTWSAIRDVDDQPRVGARAAQPEHP
jgi:GMP synthase-like glutamine amidotransferase